MTDTYTEDLAVFGFREIKMLRDILDAWIKNGLPDAFDNAAVKPAMNTSSGNVFLVNEDYQCAMMNGDKLELFHSTPYHGHEGFLTDLLTEYAPGNLNQDDIDYLLSAAENEGVELPDGDWSAAQAKRGGLDE